MFKLIALCVFAFVIGKWNQNVQATEDLHAEEVRLLETPEEGLEQDQRDSENCFSDECDDDCKVECCVENCDEMDCFTDCYWNNNMRTAEDMQGLNDDENETDERGSLKFERLSYRTGHRSPFRHRRSPFRHRRSPFRQRTSPFRHRRSPFRHRRSPYRTTGRL